MVSERQEGILRRQLEGRGGEGRGGQCRCRAFRIREGRQTGQRAQTGIASPKDHSCRVLPSRLRGCSRRARAGQGRAHRAEQSRQGRDAGRAGRAVLATAMGLMMVVQRRRAVDWRPLWAQRQQRHPRRSMPNPRLSKPWTRSTRGSSASRARAGREQGSSLPAPAQPGGARIGRSGVEPASGAGASVPVVPG